MTSVVSPPAARLRRPGWRDPRLLAGVVLVALAVALGSWAVAAAGRTVPVLATTAALTPGEPVDPDTLVIREVRLADATQLYIAPDDELDALVALRTVGAGELVPRSAVATDAEVEVRSVALEPRGALSAGVAPGASVDVWFVPRPGDEQTDAAPRQLVAGVTVAEVGEAVGALGTGRASTVHVLVPVDVLADVLAARAAEGSIEVVPLTGGERAP